MNILKSIYKYKEIILFLTTILSLIVAFYAIKVSKDIASDSGAYDKPIIEAKIGNLVLNKTSNNIIIATNPKLSDELTISTIPFDLTNIGQKNLDNFFITFKYHETSPRKIFENLDFYMEGILDQSSYKRKFTQIGDNYYVNYHFNSINPAIAMRISEPVSLKETHFVDTVKVTDKEGIPFSLTYKLDYEITFDISLSAKNISNEDYKISYSIINANSEKDFVEKLHKQFYENNKKIRLEENYMTYLFKLLFFNEYIENVVIYPNLKETKYNEYKIYFDEKPKIQTTKYKKYIWSLLLYNKS